MNICSVNNKLLKYNILKGVDFLCTDVECLVITIIMVGFGLSL